MESEIGRRVSRISTLDGGAAVVDAGYSEADRTIELTWKPGTAEFQSNMLRLLQTYSTLVVSVPSGVFSAAPDTYSPGTDLSVLRLLVTSRLSA